MPIVDGLTSTKMIRSFEKATGGSVRPARIKTDSGVPIFAVSASLVEEKKDTYIEAGFDGWILKPIDFKRLNTLLEGIYNEETRRSCFYVPGQWERGGWFPDQACSVSGSVASTDDVTPTNEDGSKKLDKIATQTEESVVPEIGMTPPTTEQQS